MFLEVIFTMSPLQNLSLNKKKKKKVLNIQIDETRYTGCKFVEAVMELMKLYLALWLKTMSYKSRNCYISQVLFYPLLWGKKNNSF